MGAAAQLPPFDNNISDAVFDTCLGSTRLGFVPNIRSGSFADIGRRLSMQDQHLMINDLSMHLGSRFKCPKPSAFYGVFDGHGGPEAAVYVRKHVMRLFFDDAAFPQSSQVDELFLVEVANWLRNAYLLTDLALADDPGISPHSGTTALTALVSGRLLVVANAGDCRAVLCRKGEAIDMSEDHKPTLPSERIRVEKLGGSVEGSYLNGVLAVSRALGDWFMKLPKGRASPLSAEPELRPIMLTEDDEFLIMACDGIWDVMSSQHAVRLVQRGLKRHNDPEQCAKDLVKEALWYHATDNLTVMVICFSTFDRQKEAEETTLWRPRTFRCCLS